jgi:two-component system chemotaxis response regulator CheB
MPVSAPIAPADGRPLAARRSPKPGSGQYRAPVGGYSVPGRSAASGGELRAGPACFGALREHAFELVVVAASTGGPPALAEFVGALPADLPVPILVVQHMPAGFLETFAERLNGLTGLSVRVARGNELVSSSQIWFAPGGRHLTVEREARALRLRLTDSAPVNGCRPSADVMFESAAYATSGNLIAVVLSGIGRDGRDGSRRVRGLGGAVYVQTASSCAVSEMPEGVRRAHLSDGAFSPGELALQIERRVTENIHGN